MRHTFGPVTLCGLVIANMIGAGVFTTSGFALAALGTPERVLAAWAVGGAVALCGALSYGALARRMTSSGGEYLFLSRALHPAAGYVAGWVSLLAGFTGAIAFAASAFEAYVLPPVLRPSWLPADCVALMLVAVAALAHGHRAALGARAQNAVVAVKLALIAGVLCYAFALVPMADWRGGALGGAVPPLQLSAFAVSVMWISLSYSGFNAAVYVAGESVDAARNVPRALIAATAVVTVVYLALNTVFVCAPPPEVIAEHEDVAARAAHALGGERFALVMRVVVALALASSVSSMLMAGPRVYARMADDGVLPAVFGIERHGPGRAVSLQALLAAIVIVSAELETLLSYLGFTLSISAALTVASLFVLRRREGAAAVPVPGFPWVPGIFVGATVTAALMAALARPAEITAGLLTLAAGLVAWTLTVRFAARRGSPGGCP